MIAYIVIAKNLAINIMEVVRLRFAYHAKATYICMEHDLSITKKTGTGPIFGIFVDLYKELERINQLKH